MDASTIAMVVLIIVYVIILLPIDLILKKSGKDGIVSHGRGVAFSFWARNKEMDHLLIPRSERSEEEKNKLKYKSIPFFLYCICIVGFSSYKCRIFPLRQSLFCVLCNADVYSW